MWQLRELRKEPAILVLLVVVSVVTAYSAALAVLTPPSEPDALAYHLARASFWLQDGGIGYVDRATDIRINTFPPVAEIGMAFAMLIGDTVYAGSIVQLLALSGASAAIFVIGRRIDLSRQESAFGALTFCTLPVVILQSSSALNDLVVASFVATSVALLFGTSRFEMVVACVSVALLVGTKLTAIVALPVLLLIVLVTHRRRAWSAVAAIVTGTFAGASWYLLNILRVGEPFRGLSSYGVSMTDVAAAIARIARLMLAFPDYPGAVGTNTFLYPAVGLVTAIIFLLRGRRHRLKHALTILAVSSAAVVLVPLANVFRRGLFKLYFEIGRQDVGYLDPHRSATLSSPTYSWY